MKYIVEDFSFFQQFHFYCTQELAKDRLEMLCLEKCWVVWPYAYDYGKERKPRNSRKKKIRWKYSLVSQHNQHQHLSWSVLTYIVSCRQCLERNVLPHGFKPGFFNLLSLPLFPAWRDWEVVLLSKSGRWIPRGCSSNLQSYSSF